jgi:glutamyl-tRNA synthetase
MTERVRFAPSPTGPLHIGGVRTALFNYLFARKNNGVFILRIEDTDQKRKIEESEEYIFESLKWAGISPDESVLNPGKFGPYRQSERNEIYKKYTNELVQKKGAYYAFDSSERLTEEREKAEKMGGAFKYNYENRMLFENSLNLSITETQKRIKQGDPYVIRLWVDPNEEVLGKDEIRNTIRVNSNELEDKILVKADGSPTYHLANVIDDHCMEITTVIRGEEWLPSLPIHILIYEKFGWDKPKFVHLPLILNPSGKGKLSKRDGDKNGYPVFPILWKNELDGYREKGFLPAAHLNYIAQLGWSINKEDEIMDLKDIVREFDLKNIQKGGARFDYEKAKWVNQQHIKRLEKREIVKLIKDKNKNIEASYDTKQIFEIAELIHDRIVLIGDIGKLCAVFLEKPEEYDLKILKKLENNNILKLMSKIERLIEVSDIYQLKDMILKFCKDENTGMGVVMQTLRMAVVGNLSGPDIVEVIKVIGKKSTLDRLKKLKEFNQKN